MRVMPFDTSLVTVRAELPDAGLGNMLLVWARAALFAHMNELPMTTSRWWRLRVGPLLRGERRSREYARYVRRDDVRARVRARALRSVSRIVREPALRRLDDRERASLVPRCYQFDTVPHWSDYFAGLRDHRAFVAREVDALLTPLSRGLLESTPAPVVGLHVRRGDFRELKPGENFAKVGSVRTPLAYFVDLIASIRRWSGERLPVTIFTDGRADELAPLLAIDGVTLAPPAPPIVDMLSLARAKVIVVSAGSTFSYWAGFLSNAAVLLHPDHVHAPLRPDDVRRARYEGPAPSSTTSAWPPLLLENLTAPGAPL